MLDEALAVVSEVAVAGIAAVVGSDVAVATGGSGCGTRGWGVCSGAVGRLGRVCRRFRAAGASFEAGGKVVVVVVNNVGCADGGCADVVSGDVADSGGDDNRLGVSSRGAVCVTALGVEVGVVCVVADCHCRSSSVCVAVSWVLDFFGVPLAFTACIIPSNPSFATRYPSSRPKFIPSSNPSSIPNFLPSSIPNFLPCFIPNFSPSSNARTQSSLRFSPSLVEAAKLQNWAMLLRSAISRKLRKSQAGVDSGAVLMFPFVGDATAVSAAAVFLFEDFF